MTSSTTCLQARLGRQNPHQRHPILARAARRGRRGPAISHLGRLGGAKNPRPPQTSSTSSVEGMSTEELHVPGKKRPRPRLMFTASAFQGELTVTKCFVRSVWKPSLVSQFSPSARRGDAASTPSLGRGRSCATNGPLFIPTPIRPTAPALIERSRSKRRVRFRHPQDLAADSWPRERNLHGEPRRLAVSRSLDERPVGAGPWRSRAARPDRRPGRARTRRQWRAETAPASDITHRQATLSGPCLIPGCIRWNGTGPPGGAEARTYGRGVLPASRE